MRQVSTIKAELYNTFCIKKNMAVTEISKDRHSPALRSIVKQKDCRYIRHYGIFCQKESVVKTRFTNGKPWGREL